MSIFINNEAHKVKALNVQQLLNEIDIEQQGIAIAINEEVITKHKWENTNIKENDKILIFTATAGG